MNPSESSASIAIEYEGGILQIVMNRPQKKNALTIDMYAALTNAVETAEKDDAVRVIVITGAGGCFTSGNDLKDFVERPPQHESSPVFRFMSAISRVGKPIVAAVSGPAVGIGTTMLLHCDLVYAGTGATFVMPFVNLGLCPEAGSSLLLPLLAGHQRAAELLLLGEPFGAETAKEIGLVNGIFAEAEVLPQAMAQARKLAARPSASVRLTKALIKKAQVRAIESVISEEARLLIQRLTSPEATEAFNAFFEHRPADFSAFN